LEKTMPFFLYSYEQKQGLRTYTLDKEIKPLAGKGPLPKIIKNRMPASAPYTWHVSCVDIIHEVFGNPSSQEIIIDLKPKVKGNISLYILKDVWGYTYDWWTPIAVLLESLHVDLESKDPAKFKKAFDDQNAAHDLVGEFLYLRGGIKGGTWGWGRVGSVNAALLWKESYRFLTGELGKFL